MTTQQIPKTKFTYGQWRLDKPKEKGYSHELLSTLKPSNVGPNWNDELLVLPAKGVNTLYKAFETQVANNGNGNFLGSKGQEKYNWMTFAEVQLDAKAFAAGCMKLDLIPQVEGEGRNWRFIGLQSKNRREWGIAHIANFYNTCTSVALYDTLGDDATKYVIQETGLTTIATQGDLVQKTIDMKVSDNERAPADKQMATFANIVSFDNDVTQKQIQEGKDAGLKLYNFSEVVNQGKQFKEWKPILPGPDDCPMFSYTSGTTGDPKGVKLTHQMLLGCAASIQMVASLGPQDTYISYLPSAHSFEASTFTVAITYGMKCGYYGGNNLKLIKEDLPMLQPTVFPSVPRIYNKIFGQINGGISKLTGIKAWLIKKAFETKLENLKSTGSVTHSLYDILFKKFRAVLGGKVKHMVTGSAPISGEVFDFIRVAFSTQLQEGYGMTETSAGSFLTRAGDPTSGHVGGPLANVKVRLRDIPEMNYLHTNDPPKGEICLWGPSIMKGYFKNEEKTREAFDGEWLRSGDVAQINPNGSVKIIDRAKNIFKLSQGEYIAPEKLENQYIKSDFVAQIWIHGDSLHDWIMVFIVVDPDFTEPWAKKRGLEFNDALMNNDTLKKEVMESIKAIATANKFNSLEKPKQIMLVKDAWTIESEMLTPTLKTKRNVAKAKYQKQIDEMYEAGVATFK